MGRVCQSKAHFQSFRMERHPESNTKNQRLWGKNWYRAQLVFFKDFPVRAPQLRFSKGFKNLNVYALPPYNALYTPFNNWREGDSLKSVLPGIVDALFGDPELEVTRSGVPIYQQKGLEPVTAPANPRNLYEKHSRI